MNLSDPLKPCSKCLRARQSLRSVARVMSQRWSKKNVLVECKLGDATILNADKTITGTSPGLEDLIGTEVYIGGKYLFNIATTERLNRLGPIVKITAVD